MARAVKILKRGILHFVDSLDLADQQLGIADQLESFGTVLDRIFQSRDQALILGEIVGLVAEVLAEMGDLASGLILNDDAVASGTGVTAGAAVAVGDEVVLGRIFVRSTRWGKRGLVPALRG